MQQCGGGAGGGQTVVASSPDGDCGHNGNGGARWRRWSYLLLMVLEVMVWVLRKCRRKTPKMNPMVWRN